MKYNIKIKKKIIIKIVVGNILVVTYFKFLVIIKNNLNVSPP